MASLQEYKTHIGGQWVPAESGETFESEDPYTGEPWALIPRCGARDVDKAVEAAYAAWESGPWAETTATARGRMMRKLGDLIAENAEALARTEVRDNGKLMSEMHAQCKYLPEWYYFYGGLADKVEGSVIASDKPDILNYTLREPIGVCAMIVPWNSPLLLVAWKLAPALAAGCTCVIKPSEFTSASLLDFMKLVERAGFPPGVVNVVTGTGKEAGEPLVTHPKVAKVAFTGGGLTGRRVYELAARGLKKVSLELGGKSPNIVFDDCIMDDAVNGVISGIFAATGQTCIAGSRALVQESIHDEFMEKLIEVARQARMGDPKLPETQVGPITTPPQYEKVLDYIGIAKDEGALCVLGGGPAGADEGGGKYFIKPTIFDNVTNDMRIAQEEVFGPVLSVITFKDEEDAIRIGNDVVYGLAAGVWTQNIKRATIMARRLRAGTVWINTYRAVSVTSPFGGYKQSGIGRENGQAAINEYLQTKSVWISTAEGSGNPFVMKVAGSS
ncbi:MAG: aldehyde dehydrogenase [Proteobacteria bacterium]|nr:aldehyde dehydrogenase [Pseudomonadota bacterium]